MWTDTRPRRAPTARGRGSGGDVLSRYGTGHGGVDRRDRRRAGRSAGGRVGRLRRDASHELYHYLDGELTEERRRDPRHLDLCGPCVGAVRVRGRAAQASSPTAARTTCPTSCATGGRGHRRGEPAANDVQSWDVSPGRCTADPDRTGRPRHRRPGTGAARTPPNGWPSGPARDARPVPADLLQADFDESTARAEELVSAATGLRSAAGPGPGPGDRPGRLGRRQRRSFQRLLGPTCDRLARATGRVGPAWPELGGPLASGGRTASRRGDGRRARLDVHPGARPVRPAAHRGGRRDQDLVYFVGPNVVALERQHGFEPREFRLWLALHEVTHRCQFTAVPWMRDYFVALVEEGLGSLGPDPAGSPERLRADDRRDPGRPQPARRARRRSAWWPPPSSWQAPRTGSRR